MKVQYSEATDLIENNVTAYTRRKEVKPESSKVNWTGKKIGGSHQGEVQIKSGYLQFENDQITGGEVEIDMSSISNTDIKDPVYNQNLIGHLKSDDFFGVEKFPAASFVITGSSQFKDGKASVSGNITIKENTEELTFQVTKMNGLYTSILLIDRSKFDVRFGSSSFFNNLKDKAIDDNFMLEISLAV